MGLKTSRSSPRLSKTCQEATIPPNSSLKFPCSGFFKISRRKSKQDSPKTLQGGHIFLLTPLLNISQPYLVPSPNSRPLQSHSEFTLLLILCLPPSLVDCRVTPSSFLAPIPLPSPFTDVYTSLCTKRKTTRVWFGQVSSNQVSLVQF